MPCSPSIEIYGRPFHSLLTRCWCAATSHLQRSQNLRHGSFVNALPVKSGPLSLHPPPNKKGAYQEKKRYLENRIEYSSNVLLMLRPVLLKTFRDHVDSYNSRRRTGRAAIRQGCHNTSSPCIQCDESTCHWLRIPLSLLH